MISQLTGVCKTPHLCDCWPISLCLDLGCIELGLRRHNFGHNPKGGSGLIAGHITKVSAFPPVARERAEIGGLCGWVHAPIVADPTDYALT